MTGRHIGVVRMDHQRDAHGLELAAGQFGAVSGRRCRHGIAIDMGEVDPTLLDHSAVAQHPGAAAATAFAAPGILREVPGAVSLLQSPADLVLQLQQEGLDLGHIRFAHLVSSQAGS
ncbi:hypothetical protein D3C86_1372130 [compost metagenome]